MPKTLSVPLALAVTLVLGGFLPTTALADTCNVQAAHVSITDPVVNEDDGTVTFHIICNPCGPVHSITYWQTKDGTATAPEDYVAAGAWIDSIGISTTPEDYPIVITLNADTDFEPNESFQLEIVEGLVGGQPSPSVGPPCFILDKKTGTATIQNDDPENQPPVAEAGGPYSVAEGGGVTLSGSGSSDPDGDALTYEWDLDNDGFFDDATGITTTFSAAGLDGPSSATVGLRVSDGVASATDSATVNVTNVAPSITSISFSASAIDEGQSVTVTGTFTDPGVPDTFTGTAQWSDGTSTPLTIGSGTFSTTRSFPDDHPTTATASDTFTVNISISDDDGDSDGDTSPTLTVNNVAPTIVSISFSASSIDEGESVTVSGSFTDPALGAGTETFSGTAMWSDGESTTLTVGSGTFSTTRSFADDDPTATPSDTFTVDITITDDDTGSDTETSPTLTVDNVAPTVAPTAVAPEPSNEGSPVIASATFTDPGTPDTFTCTVDYGDGDGPEVGTVAAGTCTGPSHTYADNGDYTVTVSITDDDTGNGSNSSTHHVDNVDPTITATSNSAEQCGATPEGGQVEVSADFSDPGFDKAAAGTLEDFDSSTIDWGDGTVEPATVAETPGAVGTATTGTVSGSHIYATGGIFTVTVTVSDDDGGSDTTTLTALVTGAGLADGLLGVVGTGFKDVVNVQVKGSDIEVQAGFIGAGKAAFPEGDVTLLQVLTCDGDDQIHVNHDVTVQAILEGGDGRDHVRAGDALSMLYGGLGNDHLFAGDLGDVLDGGDGDDVLQGGPGDDTLLGGGDNDKLFGKQGNDLIFGEAGDDELHGNGGDDALDGGAGVDLCLPGPGSGDIVVGCEL